MADETPTGTTEDATGTTAKAADGSAPAADGSGESIEELRKQLLEATRKNAQLLSEKSNVEQDRRELERRAQGAGTPPMAPEDPYQRQMATLNAIVARYGPDSYEGQMAIAQAHSLEMGRQSLAVQHFTAQVERDLITQKVPTEQRDEVRLRLLNGEYNSVQQAYEAVKGSQSTSTIEQLQRELAALKAQVANGSPPRVADVSTAVRTQVDAAAHKKNMSLSDYQRVMDQGGSRASQLMAQVDSGEVQIEY